MEQKKRGGETKSLKKEQAGWRGGCLKKGGAGTPLQTIGWQVTYQIMCDNNERGDGGKQGLVKAIMNRWVDTSAHYDFSWNGTEAKRYSSSKQVWWY